MAFNFSQRKNIQFNSNAFHNKKKKQINFNKQDEKGVQFFKDIIEAIFLKQFNEYGINEFFPQYTQ